MTKKSSLGRGLNELLSGAKSKVMHSSDVDGITDNAMTGELRQLPISMLKPGKYQPRLDIKQDSLTELSDSIRNQGVVQPLVVRASAGGSYEIIAGERRWRAAQLAGLHEVPVVVRNLDDRQAMAISLIENLQREDLHAIDTALGIKRLIDEFSMTHEAAAAAIGKSRTTVTNLLRLLSLPKEVKEMIREGTLEMGHARALLTLDIGRQLSAAKAVIKKKLSVRGCEHLVKQLQTNPGGHKKTDLNPNVKTLQMELADKLAAKVTISSSGRNGGGRIIIKYHSLDELDGILKHIK